MNPILTFRIFTLSAMIGMILLVIGFVRRRSPGPGLIFLVWCMLFFFVKELFTRGGWFNHTYQMAIPTLTLYGVPLPIVFGWTFAATLSLEIAVSFTRRHFGGKIPVMATALLSAICMASICNLIETMGVANGWWVWPRVQFGTIYHPLLIDLRTFIPFGPWSTFATVVTIPFLASIYSAGRPKWRHIPLYFLWATLFLLAYNKGLRPTQSDNIYNQFIVYGAVLVPFSFRQERFRESKAKGENFIFAAILLMVLVTWVLDLAAIFYRAQPWTLLIAPCSFLLLGFGWRFRISLAKLAYAGIGVIAIGFAISELKVAFAPVWALGFILTLLIIRTLRTAITRLPGFSWKRYKKFGYGITTLFLVMILTVIVTHWNEID